jgi:hypothetical protein
VEPFELRDSSARVWVAIIRDTSRLELVVAVNPFGLSHDHRL